MHQKKQNNNGDKTKPENTSEKNKRGTKHHNKILRRGQLWKNPGFGSSFQSVTVVIFFSFPWPKGSSLQPSWFSIRYFCFLFLFIVFLSICFQCLVSSWQSLNITTPELRLPIGRAVLKTWFPTVPPQGCQHQGFDDVGCTIVFSCAVELVIAHIPPLFSRSLPCWSLFNNLRLNLTPFVDALNILKHTGPYS